MAASFSELIIEGQFALVKGFLMGFYFGSEKPLKYFFHRKHGIRRETFGEFLKEMLEMDTYTHVCIEDNIVARFISAIERSEDKIGLKVKAVRNIKAAKFEFSYDLFNEDQARQANEIFSNVPPGVTLSGYQPKELRESDAKGMEGYAPVHEYESSASGTVEGNFGGVMDLFLAIKRSDLAENINCSEITLDLEEKQKDLF